MIDFKQEIAEIITKTVEIETSEIKLRNRKAQKRNTRRLCISLFSSCKNLKKIATSNCRRYKWKNNDRQRTNRKNGNSKWLSKLFH